jgi:hypothetical protein
LNALERDPTLEIVEAEGWYRDPYNVHTDRWFSAGRPTSLVRDHGVESHDPPPPTPVRGPLVECVNSAPEDGSDLRRADDQGEDATYDSGQAAIDHAGPAAFGFPTH